MVFFKTRAPVDPVSFVHKICQDTADGVQHKNCRFVKRLTPITGIEKANQKGLETVAEQVLAPHFHGEENVGKKVRSDVQGLMLDLGLLIFRLANMLCNYSSRFDRLSETTETSRGTT